jgi:hypothetical protein
MVLTWLTSIPGPWRVEASEGGHFIVKDANGFDLAYVYARNDEALRDKYLTPAEALVIAETIANRHVARYARMYQFWRHHRDENSQPSS